MVPRMPPPMYISTPWCEKGGGENSSTSGEFQKVNCMHCAILGPQKWYSTSLNVAGNDQYRMRAATDPILYKSQGKSIVDF